MKTEYFAIFVIVIVATIRVSIHFYLLGKIQIILPIFYKEIDNLSKSTIGYFFVPHIFPTKYEKMIDGGDIYKNLCQHPNLQLLCKLEVMSKWLIYIFGLFFLIFK